MLVQLCKLWLLALTSSELSPSCQCRSNHSQDAQTIEQNLGRMRERSPIPLFPGKETILKPHPLFLCLHYDAAELQTPKTQFVLSS